MTAQYKLGDHNARISVLEKMVTRRFDELDSKIDAILIHQAERKGEIRVLKWIAGSAATLSSGLLVAVSKAKGWIA